MLFCALRRSFLRLGDPLFCKYNEVVQSDEFIKVGGAVGVWSLINCSNLVQVNIDTM